MNINFEKKRNADGVNKRERIERHEPAVLSLHPNQYPPHPPNSNSHSHSHSNSSLSRDNSLHPSASPPNSNSESSFSSTSSSTLENNNNNNNNNNQQNNELKQKQKNHQQYQQYHHHHRHHRYHHNHHHYDYRGWLEATLKPSKNLKRRLQRLLGERSKDHTDEHKDRVLRRHHTHHHEHHIFPKYGKKQDEKKKMMKNNNNNNKKTKKNQIKFETQQNNNNNNYNYNNNYPRNLSEEEDYCPPNEVEMKNLSPAILTPTMNEEQQNTRINETISSPSSSPTTATALTAAKTTVGEEEISFKENDNKNKEESETKQQSQIKNVSSSSFKEDAKEQILHQDKLLTVIEHLKQFKVLLHVNEMDHNHIKIRINTASHTITITGYYRKTRQLKPHELSRRLLAENKKCRQMVHVDEKQCFERIVRLPRSVNISTLSSNMGTDCMLTLWMDKYFGCFHAMNSPSH